MSNVFVCCVCGKSVTNVIQATLKSKTDKGLVLKSDWTELCIRCFYQRITEGALIMEKADRSTIDYIQKNQEAILFACRRSLEPEGMRLVKTET